MCGIHDETGRPVGHHHGPIFRPRARSRSRRAFLGQFGRGTIAIAVFTPLVAACAGDGNDSADGDSDSAEGSGDESATEGDSTTTPADTAPDSTGDGEDGDTGGAANAGQDAAAGDQPGTDLRWARANLGFVSAYVLARGNSAAIVDTGAAGSAESIGQTLQTLGLTYDDVEHLILTHKHSDHVGSMAEVAAQAGGATVYAGEADLGGIDDAALGGDAIVPLLGGEDVFGFEVLSTPGHTAGHMSVIDHTTGLLVAGDAIFTENGGVMEGPERFFEDVDLSRQTIRDLAALSFNTLLVGHGDPIESNADTAVADLAASLP